MSMRTVTSKAFNEVIIGDKVYFKRKINKKTNCGKSIMFHFKARLRKDNQKFNIIQINRKKYYEMTKNGFIRKRD